MSRLSDADAEWNVENAESAEDAEGIEGEERNAENAESAEDAEGIEGEERNAEGGRGGSALERVRARLVALRQNRRAVLAAAVALDVAVVLMVLMVRWQAQVREVPEPELLGATEVRDWWWTVGWIGDLTLFPGPDAGHWAVDALRWMEGAWLDRNRAPIYTTLLALSTPLFGDLVFAGHMVNHLLSLALALVAYALGRATSGRAAAVGAAVMVACSPALLGAKGLFGVDPTQQLAIMLLALLTWWAASGRWWRLPAAGLAVGLAGAAHYLSMAFAVPAALLLVLSDPPAAPAPDEGDEEMPALPLRLRGWLRDPRRLPGARWLYRLFAPAAAMVLGYGVWTLCMMRHPPTSLWHVVHVYSEGIATYSGESSETAMTIGQAVALVLQRLGGAMGQLQQEVLGGWARAPFTWHVLAALMLIGIVGPWLRPRPGTRLGWDWRPGLWILVFMTPMVGLAASQTPGRYYVYAVPLVFLAFMRGLAVAAGVVDRLVRWKVARWPAGLLAPALCVGVAAWFAVGFVDHWDLRPDLDRDLYNRRVGQLVRKKFGPGECIITRSQEILFYSGRTGTLTAPCALYQARKLGACLHRILSNCRKDDEIPFVLEDNTHYGPGDRPNQEIQALVRENFKVEGTVKYEEQTARVYRMKRHILEAVLLQANRSK